MRGFKIQLVLLTAIFSLVGLLFVGCGGGGGGGSSSTSPSVSPVSVGSGTVAIAMTDGATDDFDEINITVVKIQLFSEAGPVTVYEGSKTFNLLDLANESRLFAISNEVPARTYSKIRLTVTSIELVRKDPLGNIIETAYPRLPGNGKLDLKRRGNFTVSAGETLALQIDMDAKKSIHIVRTGADKYQFRPVVFVDVMTGASAGKFVRLHGVVQDINATDREFNLCYTDIPVRTFAGEADDNTRGCIQVDVVDSTSIFGTDGRPASFAGLVEGEETTVYGKFRREDGDDDSGYKVEGVGKDKSKGKGKDKDKSKDSDSKDNSKSSDKGKGKDKDKDKDDDSEDRDDHGNHELGDMELVAAVIELGVEGTYEQQHGVAQSAVDADNRFTLARRFPLDDRVEPAPGTLWNFDTDAENWSISGQVTHNTIGTLTVTHDIPNVEYYSPLLENLGAEFDGALYRYVQVRVRKVAGTVLNWEGYMYWTTAGHSWSDAYRNDVPLSAALKAGEWVTLTWDMHNPSLGGEDWKNNTIKQIRFDLTDDVGPVFEIDWVVIGRRASDAVVQVQEGTRIVNRYGKALSIKHIAPDVSMMVDGVVDSAAEPEFVWAALIVIDTDANRLTRISGLIGNNPDSSCGFTVMGGSGDRSVRYDANTRAYVISASGSEEVSVIALPSGLTADVFGAEANDGCFNAETVIGFE